MGRRKKEPEPVIEEQSEDEECEEEGEIGGDKADSDEGEDGCEASSSSSSSSSSDSDSEVEDGDAAMGEEDGDAGTASDSKGDTDSPKKLGKESKKDPKEGLEQTMNACQDEENFANEGDAELGDLDEPDTLPATLEADTVPATAPDTVPGDVPPPPPPFQEEAPTTAATATAVEPASTSAAGPAAAGAGQAPATRGPNDETAPAAATGAGPNDQTAVDETRFMTDQNGDKQYKWKCDYAMRGGGGRANCKDPQCLEMHDQGGVRIIEKGELRICRRVLVKGRVDGDEGTVHLMWYHARCMFNVFLRSRKGTRIIQTPEDIENFAKIEPEDQLMLRRFISGNEDVRGVRNRGTGSGGKETPAPKKRIIDPEEFSSSKRKKVDSGVRMQKGDLVWTHCRVRPTAAALGGAAVAIKSSKPELGMIREEEKEGSLIIQFEKAEDERERLEKYGDRKCIRIRAWLRYPRIFDGKKQRIPFNWVQQKRPPPRLCGCKQQEWNHSCGCGISCSRGTSRMVWGVGS